MTALPLAVTGVGMITGVGLNARASCAAIRGAVDNFQETRFMDRDGEWIKGCQVPLKQGWRGRVRLLKMAAAAIADCLTGNEKIVPKATPLLLCLSEHERKGRIIDDNNQFLRDLQSQLGVEFHERSSAIARGHVGVAVAFRQARQLLDELEINQVLIAATDSLLEGSTLANYEENDRLLTSTNSNGLIPGEAAAALLIEYADDDQENLLVCRGLGFGVEEAHLGSEKPLRADGLTAAIKRSLVEAGVGEGVLDFRIADISGEHYYFKEASLAFSRIDRTKRQEFDIWHPADCIGEVGASIGLIMIAVLRFACEKGYARGSHMLAHLGNDDGKRSAMIFSFRGSR